MELQALISFVLILVVALFLPPVLDGIERKIKAKIHSRVGPPTIMQTWYDIEKLFSKELKLPRGAELSLLTILTGFVTALCFVIALSYSVSFAGLNTSMLALLLVLAVALHSLSVVSASATSNPFAVIGGARLIVLTIVNEIGMALSAALTLYSVHLYIINGERMLPLLILSAVMLLIAIYVACGRIPYDIHEAEPELAAGALIEFGGPALGIYLYTHLIERFLLKCFAVYLVLYPILVNLSPLLSGATILGLAVLLWAVYATISAILGRTRLDLGVKFLVASYTALTALWVVAWLV